MQIAGRLAATFSARLYVPHTPSVLRAVLFLKILMGSLASSFTEARQVIVTDEFFGMMGTSTYPFRVFRAPFGSPFLPLSRNFVFRGSMKGPMRQLYAAKSKLVILSVQVTVPPGKTEAGSADPFTKNLCLTAHGRENKIKNLLLHIG